MKGWKTFLVILGIVIIVVSGLYDQINPRGMEANFGWKQITGLIVGAIILVIGLALKAPKKEEKEEEKK